MAKCVFKNLHFAVGIDHSKVKTRRGQRALGALAKVLRPRRQDTRNLARAQMCQRLVETAAFFDFDADARGCITGWRKYQINFTALTTPALFQKAITAAGVMTRHRVFSRNTRQLIGATAMVATGY